MTTNESVIVVAILRLILGITQIAGATAGMLLLFNYGVTTTTMWVVGSTFVLSLLCRFTFNKKLDLRMKKVLLAEAIGTFCLVFAGTGAIIANEVTGGVVTHLGIGLTFGLIVMVMIYTLGEISGAHFNPAVTIGFACSRRFSWKQVAPFVTFQCLGALTASLILKSLFPTNLSLGATLPAGSETQSLVLEFLLTAILMFVILNVSTGAKEKGITAGIAIGAVIALEAIFAGGITGASMNPARSLAPAVISGNLSHLWIYIIAPIVGSLGGVAAFKGVRDIENSL